MSIYRRRLLMWQALRPKFLLPIASYRNYGRTNDDADRDMLIDLTGNGHHIKLYNFLFGGNSGYGKFNDLYSWDKPNTRIVSERINYSTIKITEIKTGGNFFPIALSNITTAETKTTKFKIIGLEKSNTTLIFRYCSEANTEAVTTITINKDGIFEAPANALPTLNGSNNTYWIGFGASNVNEVISNLDITIEQIPEYKGALVSDGIDDSGLCENFPVFKVEKGFTFIGIRKWIDNPDSDYKAFLSTSDSFTSVDLGAAIIESTYLNKYFVYSFGNSNGINDSFNNNILVCTSKKYNNQTLNKGNVESTSKSLSLFRINKLGNKPYSSIALYALEIYDRDLTDEEIEQVKARMIAEYEEKTGNRYDETGALVADYEAYDKDNEDDSRAVLEDLTGNGHDINLYNFLFAEGSGYGKYATDFSKFVNQYPNYNNTTKNKIVINYAKNNAVAYVYSRSPVVNCKIKVTGLTELIAKGELVKLSIYESSNTFEKTFIYEDGEYVISYENINTDAKLYIFPQATSPELELTNDLIIEQIPDYKGALVSDGVDDHGLCENFPILEVEKGFTILGIRKLLNSIEDTTAYHVGLISIGNNDIHTEFFGAGNITVKSFLKVSNVNEQTIKGMFLSMTSTKYNNTTITKGTANASTNNIHLFCDTNRNYKASTVLYALKIYNRDLTDEEIEKEKAKMIKRYEEKTGEKYTEV